MARCVIFCAAGFDGLLAPVQKDDFIIAADGGLRHTEALGIAPDVILGDFDSLGYVPENSAVFPVEKDDTDAMLAFRHGLALGFREFYLYGGMDGPRLDHTLANLQALQFLADRGAYGYLIGKDTVATVVKNGKLHFPSIAEGILSVFCMGQPAEGVCLTGLQYPLEQGQLDAHFPLGVSNHFIGESAGVSVESGSLLVLFPRTAPLPERK